MQRLGIDFLCLQKPPGPDRIISANLKARIASRARGIFILCGLLILFGGRPDFRDRLADNFIGDGLTDARVRSLAVDYLMYSGRLNHEFIGQRFYASFCKPEGGSNFIWFHVAMVSEY